MNIFNAVFFFIVLAIFGRLILPLRLSLRTRLLLFVLLILAAAKNYIYPLFGGTVFDPEIPHATAIILDTSRTAILFIALLLLARGILNLTYKLCRLKADAVLIPISSPFYALSIVVISLIGSVYGTYNAYREPDVTPYTVTLQQLPAAADGYKIVQLSDIHVSAPILKSEVEDIVAKTNALNPDLIVITGDIIDGPVNRRDAVVRELFKLKAKDGVYIVTGNHEYYSGYQDWHNYFVRGGFKSLDNLGTQITRNGATLFNLAGLSDPVASRFNLPLPDLKQALNGQDQNKPIILLSHRPAPALELAKLQRPALMFAGHTHGGMVLGFNQIVAAANEGFVSGWYQIDKIQLIVSNGTNLWMVFPLRIGVPSQIVEVTLKAAP